MPAVFEVSLRLRSVTSGAAQCDSTLGILFFQCSGTPCHVIVLRMTLQGVGSKCTYFKVWKLKRWLVLEGCGLGNQRDWSRLTLVLRKRQLVCFAGSLLELHGSRRTEQIGPGAGEPPSFLCLCFHHPLVPRQQRNRLGKCDLGSQSPAGYQCFCSPDWGAFIFWSCFETATPMWANASVS